MLIKKLPAKNGVKKEINKRKKLAAALKQNGIQRKRNVRKKETEKKERKQRNEKKV